MLVVACHHADLCLTHSDDAPVIAIDVLDKTLCIDLDQVCGAPLGPRAKELISIVPQAT